MKAIKQQQPEETTTTSTTGTDVKIEAIEWKDVQGKSLYYLIIRRDQIMKTINIGKKTYDDLKLMTLQ